MSALEAERQRVEDFLNAFNTIEATLKEKTGLEGHESLRTAVHRYQDAHGGWRDYRAIMAFADLRNVVVHQRYERYAYLSVPSEEVVAEIQGIRDRLLKPRTARDEFLRDEVITVDVKTSLGEILARIREDQITHFPVYREGDFAGLVTSNGITRWLSRQTQERSILELEDHEVGELLASEEERPNCTFVAVSLPVEDVIYAFTEIPQLEAALVTENGRDHEKLLGIATRWDIAAHQGETRA